MSDLDGEDIVCRLVPLSHTEKGPGRTLDPKWNRRPTFSEFRTGDEDEDEMRERGLTEPRFSVWKLPFVLDEVAQVRAVKRGTDAAIAVATVRHTEEEYGVPFYLRVRAILALRSEEAGTRLRVLLDPYPSLADVIPAAAAHAAIEGLQRRGPKGPMKLLRKKLADLAQLRPSDC